MGRKDQVPRTPSDPNRYQNMYCVFVGTLDITKRYHKQNCDKRTTKAHNGEAKEWPQMHLIEIAFNSFKLLYIEMLYILLLAKAITT